MQRFLVTGAIAILLACPMAAAGELCRQGAKVEILWSGSWWPGQVKQGPDADGRCYVSYDNYDSSWDSWVAAGDLRAPTARDGHDGGRAASPLPSDSPALQRRNSEPKPARFVAKRDECRTGERVMTRAGDYGTVTSVGATGACYITLDDGSSVASVATQFHSLSHGQGPVTGTPTMGVYDCNSPEIFIRADVMFSLRPGGTYIHFDGGRGGWSFDDSEQVLRMDSGPLRGLSYRRSDTRALSLLENGAPTSVTCVNNPAKDADRPPW